ncbi:MAG: rhodanese-like domain-containing protein [Polyangiaceae bacterium]
MVQSITAKQASELIAKGAVHVIDVREHAEFAGGHIAGARLLPLGHIQTNPKGTLPGDGVLFVCAAGVRSQTAARLARQHGATKVYSLIGGTRAWANAGLPLVHPLAHSA